MASINEVAAAMARRFEDLGVFRSFQIRIGPEPNVWLDVVKNQHTGETELFVRVRTDSGRADTRNEPLDTIAEAYGIGYVRAYRDGKETPRYREACDRTARDEKAGHKYLIPVRDDVVAHDRIVEQLAREELAAAGFEDWALFDVAVAASRRHRREMLWGSGS